MWLISLVFSITSALITSLNQQAVRRYIETPKVPSNPNDSARVRLLLFRGMKLYKMPLAILAAPALLHLSILLFFGGLVIVFHTVYEKVAIALDVAVGVSALVYMAMSLLPLLDLKCPYRTPVTYLLWHLWHAFLSFAKRFPGGCSCLCPCTCPVLLDLDDSDDSDGSDKPDDSDGAGLGKEYIPGLSNASGKVVEEQSYLTGGVINGATNPEEDEDRKTITWLFRHLSLGDENKFLVFAASIPRHKVIDLIPPIKSGKIVLRQPLLVLLQSCIGSTDDTGAVGEDVRKDALFVCLTAIHHIAKAPCIPDLNFVRGEFANINIMRVLWDDSDDFIRITSRSICALVARQVIRKRRVDNADLSWLQEVTGESSDVIHEADDAVRDLMNVRSFVYGTLPDHAYHLSTENTTSFNETLAILLDVRTDNHIYFTTPDWQIRLSEEVGRIQQYDPEGGQGVFDRLHPMFPSLSAAPSASIEAPSTHRDTPLYREAPAVHVEAPSFPRAPPSFQASFPRAPPSFQAGTPSLPRTAPSFQAGAPSFPRTAPSFQPETPSFPRAAPSSGFHTEAPSFPPSSHAEAPFPREARFAHHEDPSSPGVPSAPAPRPRRPAQFSQATWIGEGTRREVRMRREGVTRAGEVDSPPYAASPPGIIFPPAVPPSPIIPSAPAPLSRRATHSSQVTPPTLATPSPQADPPPRIISLPRAVPHPQAAPSESPPVVHPPRAIPPPRAVFPTSSRAAPSSIAVPPPSAPPTPPVASSSRTTRRFHTARPPHAPI